MGMRHGMRSEKYNVMVETEGNSEGKAFLIELRKKDLRFKGCHVKRYWQALPHAMPLKTLIPIYTYEAIKTLQEEQPK